MKMMDYYYNYNNNDDDDDGDDDDSDNPELLTNGCPVLVCNDL